MSTNEATYLGLADLVEPWSVEHLPVGTEVPDLEQIFRKSMQMNEAAFLGKVPKNYASEVDKNFCAIFPKTLRKHIPQMTIGDYVFDVGGWEAKEAEAKGELLFYNPHLDIPIDSAKLVNKGAFRAPGVSQYLMYFGRLVRDIFLSPVRRHTTVLGVVLRFVWMSRTSPLCLQALAVRNRSPYNGEITYIAPSERLLVELLDAVNKALFVLNSGLAQALSAEGVRLTSCHSYLQRLPEVLEILSKIPMPFHRWYERNGRLYYDRHADWIEDWIQTHKASETEEEPE